MSPTSVPHTAFDYCPFCGMHLPTDGFDAHLDEYEDCAEQFESRDGSTRNGWGGSGDASESRQLSGGVRTVVLAAIVFGIIAYSFLVTQRLLLGVVASVIVVVAFLVTPRLGRWS